MSDLIQTVNTLIRRELQQNSIEVVGIVPLSNHTDQMVRMRTLEELLREFEDGDPLETQGFIVQVKKRREPVVQARNPHHHSPEQEPIEALYSQGGEINLPFLLKTGDTLYQSKDYLLARNIYQFILRSGKASSTALYHLGRCFEAEEKLEEAQAHYEESIAFCPTWEACHRLAEILIQQHLDEQAAEVLERVLHLKDLTLEQKFEIYKSCGNCWTRAKMGENAHRNFQKALEIMPHADEVRSNLGALYLQQNKISESRRHFQDAIASNPKNYRALAGLGSCFLAEGDKKMAHDYFSESLELHLNNPNALFYLVKCAYDIKVYGTAAKFLREYIKIAAVNANLLYSLAGLDFQLGRIAEAKTITVKTLDLQKSHSGALELMRMIEKYSSTDE